jgi:hypothetical protein
VAAFNRLYGGGVCITDVGQLSAALASDQFKAKSNYEAELMRVRDFGKKISQSMGK